MHNITNKDFESIGLVDIKSLIPNVELDIRYATDNNNIYHFRCFFGFNSSVLEKMLDQTRWFYREVITDPSLIEKIKKNLDKPSFIMKELNLKMFVRDLNNPLSHEVIKMLPYYEELEDGEQVISGIIFEVVLTDDLFTFTPSVKNDNSGYISYHAKISFKLMADNTFYCIFPEPCLNPKFRIEFADCINIKNDVKYISCMSVPQPLSKNVEDHAIVSDVDLPITEAMTAAPNKGYRFFKEMQQIQLDVDNNLYVFPRSGVYFSW